MLTVNTYVGFRILDKLSDKDKSVIEFNDSSVEIILPQESIVPPSSSLDDITGSVGNDTTNNGYGNVDFDKIIIEEDTKHKELCALYDQLLVSGIDTKDIDRELSNILLVKLSGVEVNQEQRLVLFNSLRRTVAPNVDVIEYYYPLAQYTHMNNCTEVDHDIVDGRLTCKGLEQVSSDFKIESFSEFVVRKALETGSLTMVDSIQRIMASDFTLSECLPELDAIYVLCSIPTDVSEELWMQLFGKLLTTTNEFENVCYVYYDLALLVHKLTCEYPHYVNQFGVTECVGNMPYKLT